MTRADIKRHMGWTPNFKNQPSEEERIEEMKQLIAKTEKDLEMFKAMLEEKDLW